MGWRTQLRSTHPSKSHEKNDEVFFYHSNDDTAIVGIAKVDKAFYTDPTADSDAWVAVDVKPVKQLKNPVTLAQVKANKKLLNMALVRISRLSVQPVSSEEWKIILSIAGEK